jgi:hypothetical protein
MADPRFKVKRQAYFKRGITTASTLDVDGAVNLNSTLTVDGVTTQTGALNITGSLGVTGGLTASSTLTSSTSAIFGSGGTPIAGILAGSGELVYGNIAASTASATCFTVTGLTAAHKIFLTAACVSGCMYAACVYANPATPTELVVTMMNIHAEQVDAGTSSVYYLAVLDK